MSLPLAWFRNLLPFRFIAVVLAGLLLAACASLPDVHYLRERQFVPQQEPTIITVRGEMPDGKKQALLDGLAARVGPTDILARHIAAEEQISGRPLIAGNKVMLLDDGPATMRAMMAAIRGARDHVNLETYIFEADEVGLALADLLIQKKAAGVAVNLIYDSVGTLDAPSEFFERLRAAGINLLEFNPINPARAQGDWAINHRDHRKILVVDGRIAFTGGVNISKVYGKSSFLQGKRRQQEPPRDAKEAAWRDTHMQIEGPAVAEFQRLFLDTWQRKSGAALPDANYFPPLRQEGRSLVRAIGSTPERQDFSVYKTYISAFAHADRYIHLTTAYFVPDRQVVEAMIDAARRGVDVRIIFPSFTDVGLLLYAGRSYYDELLAAGIKVYERKSAMLHAKTAVIDGVWSTIGSTNLDMRSFLHNDEVNAVVLGVDFAERMEALFQRDLQESVAVTAEAWSRRGLRERLREWAVRLFEYWL
ncbi:MAG TPA: phospholipase D-like domain-containing protein [Noviherbaspirillum sp.]|uniref:phospholipase D-like domain-containing protein n=1 Tax=Noviherbaspirillum sp. TaxID=1926288 RepID=UPI002D72AF9E|nr:phospholipase D-like domain-containing protein [Noviherbaspirillum sp.]HYD96305.1 phospholipase D-like domain-containing protein [Noviherbaspirillum sp.]